MVFFRLLKKRSTYWQKKLRFSEFRSEKLIKCDYKAKFQYTGINIVLRIKNDEKEMFAKSFRLNHKSLAWVHSDNLRYSDVNANLNITIRANLIWK
jgi:hypothetical protein